MTYNQFIDQVIFNELHNIIYTQHLHYHGFILMACTIEFAGMLLDKAHDIHAQGRSKKRFEIALKEFASQYHGNQILEALYNTMRCGMCHALRPSSGVLLTHRQEAINNGILHLQRDQHQNIYFISENLYDDLCDAIRKIKLLPISQKRNLDEQFLVVPQDDNTISQTTSGAARISYLGTGCNP